MAITQDMIISELVEKYPRAAEYLYSLGISCMGCHVSEVEKLGDGLRGHGMNDAQVERLVSDLNKIIEAPAPEPQEEEKHELEISPEAALKIIFLCKDKLGLRIKVRPGGCSGYETIFSYADELSEQDEVVEHSGAKVVIDRESFGKISGSRLVYKEALTDAGFKLENPNAKAMCGCGSSFAV